MQANNHKGNTNTPLTLLVLMVGLIVGIFIGLQSKTIGLAGGSSENAKKIEEVLSLIEKEYVDTVNTKSLVDNAINNILLQLDPHSIYITKESRQAANEDLSGNFEGIGIEFNIFRDTLIVISPLIGGPSEKAGLLSGDKIVMVDGENIAGTGLQNSDVMKKLKGPENTKVEVKVVRKNIEKPIAFTITRGKIPQTSINAAYMIDREVGYIKVSKFSQTTYSEFDEAFEKLTSQGLKKLILDLQGNPGGYMSQAIALVDEFLPVGAKIVFTKGKDTKYDSEIFSTNKGRFKQGDLVVLIDEGSSSASEIVAGALQENDRALIVGRRSYGKGLVQSPFSLKDGSELRLTISRYYTPSGRSIQKPYNNHKKYITDIAKRYEHGELFYADSITVNDSLRYRTSGGRTVYGGGGITPDYFVPLDTTFNTLFITKLLSSNSLQECAFQFAMDHKSALTAMGVDNFYSNFTISDHIVGGLIEIAKRNHVEVSQEQAQNNRHVLNLLLKANIGRKIWSNEIFYPIINQSNKVLQRALKLLNKKERPVTASHTSKNNNRFEVKQKSSPFTGSPIFLNLEGIR